MPLRRAGAIALALTAVAGAALTEKSVGLQPLRVASTFMAPAIGRGDWSSPATSTGRSAATTSSCSAFRSAPRAGR